jgi:hypothetical protein
MSDCFTMFFFKKCENASRRLYLTLILPRDASAATTVRSLLDRASLVRRARPL